MQVRFAQRAWGCAVGASAGGRGHAAAAAALAAAQQGGRLRLTGPSHLPCWSPHPPPPPRHLHRRQGSEEGGIGSSTRPPLRAVGSALPCQRPACRTLLPAVWPATAPPRPQPCGTSPPAPRTGTPAPLLPTEHGSTMIGSTAVLPVPPTRVVLVVGRHAQLHSRLAQAAAGEVEDALELPAGGEEGRDGPGSGGGSSTAGRRGSGGQCLQAGRRGRFSLPHSCTPLRPTELPAAGNTAQLPAAGGLQHARSSPPGAAAACSCLL